MTARSVENKSVNKPSPTKRCSVALVLGYLIKHIQVMRVSKRYENQLWNSLTWQIKRVRPGIYGPKPVGPIKFWKSRTGPDQDRKNFRNPGPARTRTQKNFKISEQTEPGPTKFWKCRTDSDRSVPGFGGPWIPGWDSSLRLFFWD